MGRPPEHKGFVRAIREVVDCNSQAEYLCRLEMRGDDGSKAAWPRSSRDGILRIHAARPPAIHHGAAFEETLGAQEGYFDLRSES